MPYSLPLGILGLAVFTVASSVTIMLASLHPLSLALVIMLIALAVGSLLSSMLAIWALLALLLVFLGGMMVVFSYMTTLASNDKLSTTSVSSNFIPIWFLLALCSALFMSSDYTSANMGIIYSLGSGTIILFLTLYLLMTLLVIVKITQSHKGALTTWS